MKLEINNDSLQSLSSEYSFGKVVFLESDFGSMLRTGVKLAQEGNRSEARYLLLRVTESDPENETAWLWLASISEYPEELLIFLQNVLRINPENERAIEWAKATKTLLAKTFVQRGIDAFHDSQTDFAKQCFLQAIVHDAENEMAWLWLASVTESGEEKILHLQKVLSFNPENETALSTLKSLKQQTAQSILRKANSAAISGERETARILLEEVMKDSPDLEEAWILKAYLTEEFYEKLGCYERVLQLNPDNEAAQAGKASLRILIEKSEAQTDFSQQIAELKAEETSEQNSQIETENLQDNAADFTEEVTEPELYADESLQLAPSEEFAEENPFYEAPAIEIEAKNQMSADDYSDNYAMPNVQISEAEVNSSEVRAYDEEFSSEYFQAPVEEKSFHSESPTERLERPVQQETETQTYYESEIELLESHPAETEVSSEAEEPEFSLEMEPENQFAGESYVSDAENSDLNEDAAEKTSALSDNFQESSEVKNEFSFADLNEETEENQTSNEQATNNVYETSSFDNYVADYNQPTVEFSYNESFAADADETSKESEAQNFAPENHFYQSNEVEVEEKESSSADKNFEVFAPEQTDDFSEAQSQVENVECPLCEFSNETQAISCNSCRTILSLSDLEMLLAHQEADREVLAQTIEKIEMQKASRELSQDELCLLGIAYLNAKYFRKGLEALQEASKITPNDVVLSSKINFLAIRLSEIELQENRHLENAVTSRMIMVVDDSPTVRKLISGKLEKSGHTVVTATDGIDALSKMNEKIPDLVLLDIAMPQLDGYQVCKMIRNNEATKDIPVVMISGKDGFFDKVRGRMAGSTGYITKPFGPETLMKTVETYINQ